MSYARDKLYQGYLRRNMPKIVSSVKVKEIIPYLPCLTDHDRENIEAKRETYGNYDGMMLLLDCLKRRESWPEQFIQALEACEHPTIAAEIKAEYDTLRGASSESANSNPSSPSTTVVQAHVHPAPSVSHPPVPESGGCSQAAVSSPAEASAPPGPAAQSSPPVEIPVQPQSPQIPAADVPEDVPPPEPVAADPPKAAQIEVAPPPSTPPPSPATPHIQKSSSPPPEEEITPHQEPEENSESDIQDICEDNAVSTRNGMVQIDAVGTPEPPCPVEQSESDTPSCQDTPTTITEVRPPRSPSPTENVSDVAVGAPVPMATPEKPPVQETTLPSVEVLEPEETPEPPTEQATEANIMTEAAATAPAIAAAAVSDTPLCNDSSVYLSKPGELISVHPQNHDSPTIRAASPPAEPYSGDSDRLQISTAEPDTVTSAHTPACSAVSSSTEKSVTAPPCQENGIDNTHNEPEENHYESPAQSLVTQEVLVHEGHVSGEPSILDLAVQDPAPQAQFVNGEASKEMKPVSPVSTDPTDTASPSKENCHPSEPAAEEISPQQQTQKDSEERAASRALPANTKYIVAAGVGACALLMAWKFKK